MAVYHSSRVVLRSCGSGTARASGLGRSSRNFKLTKKQVSSKQQYAEKFLAQTIQRFRECRPYISRLRKSGGRAELFVGLMSTKNFALELHPDLLRSAASLGIAITFDVYPYPQNDR